VTSRRRPRRVAARLALAAIGGLAALAALAPRLGAESDLDVFMREALARRDDNWRKLQQYVLDEAQQIELLGPSRTRIWGERREFLWFVRDGFFIRSPIKVNGATISEPERRRYEDNYLRIARRREGRGAQPSSDAPGDVDSFIRQTRQPQFITSAYFLRFRFEEGKYALVGHESLDGRDTLKIEYYPTNLYTDQQRRRQSRSHDPNDPWDVEMNRLMNKVALVTLWIDPGTRQIVRYTFDNISFDFLPAQWLVRVNTVRASMTMGQPFPDVWLPAGVEFTAGVTLAIGDFDARYTIDYRDYRRADVTTNFSVPGAR
jgi:hypothetical protein